MTKDQAQKILLHCGADDGSDNFHALHSYQVQQLLDWADALRYRKPRNANGSRARYFHAYLQRRAAKGEK